MNKRTRTLIILIALSSIVAGCSSPLGEDEAKRLARKRIEDYAKSERLAPSAFGNPTITSEPGHKWVFDYTSNTSPRHLVRVYVDSRDKVEVSRMVDIQP